MVLHIFVKQEFVLVVCVNVYFSMVPEVIFAFKGSGFQTVQDQECEG